MPNQWPCGQHQMSPKKIHFHCSEMLPMLRRHLAAYLQRPASRLRTRLQRPPMKTEPFLFFGEEENSTTKTEPAQTATLPQNVTTQPAGTAEFFGSEEPQLTPAAMDEQPRSLGNGAPVFDLPSENLPSENLPSENLPFGGQPEPAAATGQQNDPFPGLPEATRPEPIETENSGQPFTSDLVPTPREPATISAPAFTVDPDENMESSNSIPVNSNAIGNSHQTTRLCPLPKICRPQAGCRQCRTCPPHLRWHCRNRRIPNQTKHTLIPTTDFRTIVPLNHGTRLLICLSTVPQILSTCVRFRGSSKKLRR